MESAKDRIGKIIRILGREYPGSHTMLAFETPFQLLVATILSAQSRDDQINKVTPGLFRKYPTVRAFAEARPSELEKDIHSTGFFRNKTRSIIGAAKAIVADFGGRVPDTMAELVTLPGVARKTANIVLSSAFGKAEGIAVDVHVKRLAGKLGLSEEHDPNKIERDLMALVPKRHWGGFNYLLVNHGRAICHARKPECGVCGICELCPSCGRV
jgi:endonuclease-3